MDQFLFFEDNFYFFSGFGIASFWLTEVVILGIKYSGMIFENNFAEKKTC